MSSPKIERNGAILSIQEEKPIPFPVLDSDWKKRRFAAFWGAVLLGGILWAASSPSSSHADARGETPSSVTALAEHPPLDEAETQAFLETMRQSLASVQTLQARFVQERRVSMFVDTLVTTGVCLFEPPQRLRWEMTEPYVSVLIHTPRGVSKFDKEEGQLRKMRLGGEEILTQVLEQIGDWMRGDFTRAREAYTLEVRRAPAKALLILRPRSEKMSQMLQAIELTINTADCHVTQVVIRETAEDSVQIRFVREKINAPVPDRAFDLKTPLWPLPDLF